MASGAPSPSRDRLGRVISARIEAWGGAELPLERLTFGTTEPDTIAAAIDAWCATFLGAGIEQYHFFDSSSGSVHGVRLARRPRRRRQSAPAGPHARVSRRDQHRAARVRRTRAPGAASADRAGSVRSGAHHRRDHARQRAAGRRPRPGRARCTRARARPRRRGGPCAGTRRHRRAAPPHRDAARRALPASALGPVRLRGHRGGRRVDRRVTCAGRAPALAAGDPGPDVLVHGDWRIENANVAAGEVVAIYDWDSVCVEPELFAVATSAVTFCVDWLRPIGEHFPTNAEIRAFIGEYETARGAPFSDDATRPPRRSHRLWPLLRRALRTRRQLPGGRRLAAGAPTPPRRPAARSRTGQRCGPDNTNRRG